MKMVLVSKRSKWINKKYYKQGEKYLAFDAYYEIARMYEYGFNVEKDIKKAIEYYKKSRYGSLSLRKIKLLSNLKQDNDPFYTNFSMNCNVF